MTMRQVAIPLAMVGVVFVLVFGVLAGCGSSTANMDPDEVAKAVSPEISEASVRENLEHLTGESPSRFPGARRPPSPSAAARKGGRRPPST
jgi:hypothetical protein